MPSERRRVRNGEYDRHANRLPIGREKIHRCPNCDRILFKGVLGGRILFKGVLGGGTGIEVECGRCGERPQFHKPK